MRRRPSGGKNHSSLLALQAIRGPREADFASWGGSPGFVREPPLDQRGADRRTKSSLVLYHAGEASNLGAYTTFSTFSYETFKLIEDGAILFAALNVAFSITGGLPALYLGVVAARLV